MFNYLLLFLGFLGLLIGLSIAAQAKCFYIFSFSPLPIQETLHGFSAGVVVIFLITYAVLMWLGYLLSKPFWCDLASTPRWIKFVAGFFIGYLVSIGVLRLVSFFIPYASIYIPVMLLLFMACVMMQCRIKDATHDSPGVLPAVKLSAGYSWMGVILIILFLAALLQLVKQGDFNFNGHGYRYYAYLIDDWKANPPLHFPLITKHYDEIIFHYFLTANFPPSFPNLLAWWITLGVLKVSVFAFIFLLFRKLGMQVWMSLISVLFIFLGTTSLNPSKYFLLFDSSNLLFFVVHAGRLVMVPFLLLLIADAVLFRRRYAMPWFFYLLSGIGLASTSISNPVWVLLMLAVLMLYGFIFKDRQGKLDHIAGLPAAGLCYLSVIVLMALYALDFKHQWAFSLRVGLLALLAGIAAFRFVKVMRMAYLSVDKFQAGFSLPLKPILLGVSILLSLLLLGNMLASNPLARSFWKAAAPVVGSIDVKVLPTVKGDDVVPESGDWSIGDFREVGAHNEYCKGLVQFVNYYGLLLVMILLVNYFFTSYLRRASNHLSLADALMHELFLVNVLAMPFLFFFMDFVNFASRAWLKSRFLEGPVYIIIFVFLYVLHRCCSLRQQFFFAFLLVAYTVIPFIATARPQQILYNFQALIKPLLG